MDHQSPKERNIEADLESGATTSGQDLRKYPTLGAKKQGWTFFSEDYRGFIEGSVTNDNGVKLSSNIWNGINMENVNLLTREGNELEDYAETKLVKEKCKKISNKKALKPPRPPKGPTLDAADQKLIRELSELALLKRARIERMKALKKMKAAGATKPSSTSSSSLLATVFTILFFVVIIIQGLSSRTRTPVSIEGSPLSGEGNLISVEYFGNPTANSPNGLSASSESPNLVEQFAGSDYQENLRGTG